MGETSAVEAEAVEVLRRLTIRITSIAASRSATTSTERQTKSGGAKAAGFVGFGAGECGGTTAPPPPAGFAEVYENFCEVSAKFALADPDTANVVCALNVSPGGTFCQ